MCIQVLAQDKADAVLKEIGYPDWLPNNTALDEYFIGVWLYYSIFIVTYNLKQYSRILL